MPNTDYTDYTDQGVSNIICEDNVNVIFPTALSSNIPLYYCFPVFPRLYQHTTYMTNTDYIDYTDCRFSFIISEDNVNVIFPTSLSFNTQS